MARSKQEGISPAAMNTIRPGTTVLPLSQSEDEALSALAKKYNLGKSELMLRLINKEASKGTPKLEETSKSLDKIIELKNKLSADNTKNNPMADLLQFKIYKDVSKEIQTTDNGRMSAREMMEMLILKSMLNENNGNNNNHTSASEAELNFNHKIELMETKHQSDMKDMENRHQAELTRIAMEKKFDEMQNVILGEVDALRKKLELQSKIPQTTTSLAHKDPIRELEEMGGKMQRIKDAISPFLPAHVNTSGLAAPGAQTYRNADGTTDWVAVVERVGGVVGRTIESFNKKTPEMGQITPTGQEQQIQQQPQQQRQLSLEEYSEILLRTPNRTPEQNQWLMDYYDHLEREREKLGMVVEEQQPQEPTERERVPYSPPSKVDYTAPAENVTIEELPQEVQRMEQPIEQPIEPPEEQPEEQPENFTGEEKREEPNEHNSTMIAKLKQKEEQHLHNLRDIT